MHRLSRAVDLDTGIPARQFAASLKQRLVRRSDCHSPDPQGIAPRLRTRDESRQDKRPRPPRAWARSTAPGGPRGVRDTWHGVCRRRRHRRIGDRRRQGGLSLHLGSEDLINPFRNVRVTAVTRACCHQASLALSATEVSFDRLSSEFRHGRVAPFGFVPEPSVKVVRELYCRALHGMSAYHPDCQCGRTAISHSAGTSTDPLVVVPMDLADRVHP